MMFKILYLPEACYLRGCIGRAWANESEAIFASVKRDLDTPTLFWQTFPSGWTGVNKAKVKWLRFATEPAAEKFIRMLCSTDARARIGILDHAGVFDGQYDYHAYVVDRRKPRHQRSDNYFKAIVVPGQFDILEEE